MIVRNFEDVAGSDRDVAGPKWRSVRLLTRADGCGFSVHDTVVEAGAELSLWYKHHIEACYCIEGRATVENCSSGEVSDISAGTLYALDAHDRHILRAETRIRLICVFNPPLAGTERHDADGSYLLAGE